MHLGSGLILYQHFESFISQNCKEVQVRADKKKLCINLKTRYPIVRTVKRMIFFVLVDSCQNIEYFLITLNCK